MTPTLFGVLVLGLCALLLWRAGTLAMFQTVLLLSLMGGSAALVLSGLGGSTLQPAILALAFLLVKCILPGSGGTVKFYRAVGDLAPLGIFVLYGAAGAFILPYIFAGQINVTPLRPIPNGYIYASFPLGFSPQNVTSAVYLLATLIAAICGHIACQAPNAEAKVARTMSIVAMVHAFLGISGVTLAGTAWTEVLSFFRNGFYAQLDQRLDGIIRMNGIWPEPAAYAAYGFTILVFVGELWLRDVDRRWTGWAALLLGLALLASTSTTAYVGLFAYALVIALRILLIPGSTSIRKALVFIVGGMIALAAAISVLVVNPDLAVAFGDFFARLTTEKASSASALQRSFWARQGIEAFWASGGLGVGPGSFRSSSIITAVLGSTGIIGFSALLFHLFRVFKPTLRSTYLELGDRRTATGAAASWAALLSLIPASVAAATPDPGFVWGFLCGIALALRSSPLHQIRMHHPQLRAVDANL